MGTKQQSLDREVMKCWEGY